jgi:predicted Rossmann fold nucleotide-binding protein DprA/Smf involved in DNA uptake
MSVYIKGNKKYYSDGEKIIIFMNGEKIIQNKFGKILYKYKEEMNVMNESFNSNKIIPKTKTTILTLKSATPSTPINARWLHEELKNLTISGTVKKIQKIDDYTYTVETISEMKGMVQTIVSPLFLTVREE